MNSLIQENAILQRTFDFALTLIDYCEKLEAERKYVIAKQLLRSGTSIGANVREAQVAESRADFIHKMKIAGKEAEETAYWLDLCRHAVNYPDPEKLIDDIKVINRMITKIVVTARRNAPRSRR